MMERWGRGFPALRTGRLMALEGRVASLEQHQPAQFINSRCFLQRGCVSGGGGGVLLRCFLFIKEIAARYSSSGFLGIYCRGLITS